MALLLKIAGAFEAGAAECAPQPLAPLDVAADAVGAYRDNAPESLTQFKRSTSSYLTA